MSDLTAHRIAELTIEALERTAFVLADPIDQDECAGLPGVDRFARIAYSGPTDGHVFICASDGFVRELAASLLGVDASEVSDTTCTDALRELANIVGGSVTLELGGEERRLLLGLPEDVQQSDVPTPGPGMEHCCLESEGERLEVIWAPSAVREAAA